MTLTIAGRGASEDALAYPFLITYNAQSDLITLDNRHVGREVSIHFIHPAVDSLDACPPAQIRWNEFALTRKALGKAAQCESMPGRRLEESSNSCGLNAFMAC
ncbi:MAG: hypothetical protein ACU83N_15145 [Gammaproteobacteria bacterium]